jgi:DNA invertase Pin-like site-specific DNA recombinase
MTEVNVDGVGYWRMSSSPQEKSIPQQRAEMLPRCQLERVTLVAEFKDEGKSGGGMRKRDDFLDMLAFCQQRYKAGKPIEAVVAWNTSRFSRATSIETAHYIWEFQQVGVHRVFTFERWFDFRKEEDRAIFLLQQDFTNNRFLRDLSESVLRGKKDAALAGFFTGGTVPYGFDRVLVDQHGLVKERIPGGQQGKLLIPKDGRGHKLWRVFLSPIPEDDPDPARQLERQTAIWLYETFDAMNVSFRWLATQLNDRGVPAPCTHYNRKPGRWVGRAVRDILTRPVYAGTARTGDVGRGLYHRLVAGEVRAVSPGSRKTYHAAEPILAPLQDGGLVTVDLWQRVQAKAQARTRACPLSGRCRTLVRANDYVIPSGILHCGHCGGRVYGCTLRSSRRNKAGVVVRRYRYPKLACSSTNRKQGSCRAYTVDEGTVLDELINQLLTVYTDPKRLEALRQKLHDRHAAKVRRAPIEVERLRKQLEAKDVEVRDAARNVLRAKNNADLLNDLLTELRAERQKLAQQLAAAEKALAEAEPDETKKTAAEVEAAIARLFTLREQLLDTKTERTREKLGALIQAYISRVDLFFEPEYQGKRLRYLFVKGVIKLRPLVNVQGSGRSGR